jgi:hypothetical protein
MSNGKQLLRSPAAPGADAVPCGLSSYPGGKSGAGIYQRLINMIPPHRVLITAFAGQCGVTRNIKPAEHTIVIDADAKVCQWWDSWRRTKNGRALEIHHCDSIEWLRFWFGQTEYSAAKPSDVGSRDARAGDKCLDADKRGESRIRYLAAEQCDAAGCRNRGFPRLVMNDADRESDAAGAPIIATPAADAKRCDGRPSLGSVAEAFVFCDPPYVLSCRAHGKQYTCELTDSDHVRLLSVLAAIPTSLAAIMLCGYASPLYATVDREWRAIDHRVPTRGGLQDERIWMNYDCCNCLHDYRYVGECRRDREKVRRRQRNWVSQLQAMTDPERAAMLDALRSVDNS